MGNEEVIEYLHGQGEAWSTNPTQNESPKHNLGMGTHLIHVCGHPHMRVKVPTHVGFLPTWRSSRACG